jgi:hypothetical protein
MTWTYTDTLLTDRDKVRWYSGDTDTTDQLVTDEEITGVLTIEPNYILAAASVCEHLAALYSRKADKVEGRLSIRLSQKSDQYTKKAAQLRQRAGLGAIPYAGGIFVDDVDAVLEDTARVQNPFPVGMLDNPDASSDTETS